MANEKSELVNPITTGLNNFPFKFFNQDKNQRIHVGCFYLDKPIGTGKYAKVYSLKLNEDISTASTNSSDKLKIAKYFELSKDPKIAEEQIQNIYREYKLGSQTPHLDMEEPVVGDGWAVIVMNHIQGQELHNFIDKRFDYEKDELIKSIPELLQISKNLLVSLKNQVINSKLIHCDINPVNIIVQSAAVNIIDFGLAMGQGESYNKSKGVYQYMAPEIVPAPGGSYLYSSDCDIYSMGKVFALLWLDYFTKDFFEYYESQNAQNVRENAERFYEEFTNNQLNEDYPSPEFIKTLIENMVIPDPEKRWNIDRLIEFFEKEYQNYLEHNQENDFTVAASSSTASI